LKPGQSVLDLAYGTGHVALRAKKVVGETGHVVGVNISEGMLKVAKRKAKAAGLDVPFINNDIIELSSLDILLADSEGFDVITCASALILLQEPLQAVKHWKSLLLPNGCLIAGVQTKDANVVMNVFAAIASELGELVLWNAQQWQSKDALVDLMIDAGLLVEKIFETEAYAQTYLDHDMTPKLFDQAVGKSMFDNFGRGAVRDEAKALLVEKFADVAGPKGSIDQKTRYWVVVTSRGD
jgi:ubiquinone/menaquinone biosynthesis C-methylase UbiE